METQTETTSPRILGTPIAVWVEEHGGFARTWKDAGVEASTLYRVMIGRHSPRYETRLKLARAFGCRVDEITFPADAQLKS